LDFLCHVASRYEPQSIQTEGNFDFWRRPLSLQNVGDPGVLEGLQEARSGDQTLVRKEWNPIRWSWVSALRRGARRLRMRR
jgi:hypothetical protein